MAMTRPVKLDQPPQLWDRLFAPSSCLAMITTVDADGRVNAASYGTCTRVVHDPVHIAFTCSVEGALALGHTAANVRATGEFVVNLPSFDRVSLEQVRVVGLPFARGVNELEKAGLTALPSRRLKPPRIAECPRHFECEVEWTREWVGRLMVVGRVVAASVDADKVDARGYVLWDKIKPAHFCGAPYHNMFVGAYETMAVDNPYQGPEVELYRASEKAMLKEA
jgi:flavin reductase (DIM6/NTAB) family NADH-FMN oxidoreductase RutF